MTVSTTTNKVRINGNGITTSFPFQFPILKNDFSDLKVYRIDINEETQEETATLLSITTNYTITVTKNLEQRITSGYVNLINENNEPLALTENQALFIMREEEITQDLDLYENQKFPYKNLENMLDKIIVINQQQQEQIDRTLKTSSFFTGSLSETITSPVENRSLKWKKKQDGTFYVSNSDTDIDEVYNQTVNNPNVIAVGQNINNVNISANNINDINTTANNISNVNNVAGNLDNIDIVNENIDNINVIKNNIHNINTTANNIASVNNVAGNITALNSINNWINTSDGTVNYYIGQVIQVLCSSNYIPSGCLPCNGAEYTKAQFPDLWDNYLTTNPSLLGTVSYNDYNNTINVFGQCPLFAVDTENNKFKVPTIKDGSYITQAKSDSELGRAIAESLPNIKSTTGALPNIKSSNAPTGSMYLSGSTSSFNVGGSTNVSQTNIGFDASLSSSTYQDGAKVQGDNVRARFFVVVANGEINQSIMDWSAWATSLQTKANINLDNINTTAKETITNLSAPSSRYIEISLPASTDMQYTAPANGYISVNGSTNSNGGAVQVYNSTKKIGNSGSRSSTAWIGCSVPVEKGDVCTLYEYNCSNYEAKFIYSNGN